MRYLFLLSILLSTISCTYKKIDINPSEFQKIPSIDYTKISPCDNFDCWSLYENGTIYHRILFTSNENCRNTVKLNKIPYAKGFSLICAPTCIGNFILSKKNKETRYWATIDSLKIFLGSIDNISEAQLLAIGNSYYVGKRSLYKLEKDNYILVLYKMVNTGPYQVDKFLLRITRDGRIKIMGREVVERNPDIQI